MCFFSTYDTFLIEPFLLFPLFWSFLISKQLIEKLEVPDERIRAVEIWLLCQQNHSHASAFESF